MEEPLEILTLFRRVRAGVLASTNGEQRPHEYQSLLDEHYLLDAPALDVPVRRDPERVEAALGLEPAVRRRIQQRLAAAGFSPGPADGVFGPATRAAIRGWQTSRGATATGYLDVAGAAALGAPVPSAALPTVATSPADVSAPLAAASVPAAELTRAEMLFWESMRDSPNASDFEAYLTRWPSGIYAPLATNRLAALREAASTPPAAGPRPVPPATPRPGSNVDVPAPDVVRPRDARAQNELGFQYETAGNYREALRWYRRAAVQGYASAEYHLGFLYEHGRGVPVDQAEAVRWYRRAAAQDHAPAQRALDGTRYASPAPGETTDARAQNELGFQYETAGNYREALRWYRRAAVQGYASAEYRLGFLHEHGRGVPVDRAEAARWFRRAAAQGHAAARRGLDRVR